MRTRRSAGVSPALSTSTSADAGWKPALRANGRPRHLRITFSCALDVRRTCKTAVRFGVQALACAVQPEGLTPNLAQRNSWTLVFGCGYAAPGGSIGFTRPEGQTPVPPASDCLMPEGLEVNCEVYCTTTIL